MTSALQGWKKSQLTSELGCILKPQLSRREQFSANLRFIHRAGTIEASIKGGGVAKPNRFHGLLPSCKIQHSKVNSYSFSI